MCSFGVIHAHSDHGASKESDESNLVMDSLAPFMHHDLSALGQLICLTDSWQLRWFLSIALSIPTVHDFCVISAWMSVHVHVHNKKNFPQAKLYSEINVRFRLNKHDYLYFLFLYNSVHIILFNLKKITKFFIECKKRHGWKSAQNCYCGMQIMTTKTTAIQMLYIHVVLNSVISWQILWYCSICLTLSNSQVFPKYNF